MQGIKHPYEYIKELVESLGYTLISDSYNEIKGKLVIKDNEGYYYYTILTNLIRNHKPDIAIKNNPYSIQNIKLWLKLNNKEFELISDKYIDAHKDLVWKCLKINCQETFTANWNHVHNNRNCPYCAGERVGFSNCLATKNPELAKQWHPTRNGDLTPYNVTYGSNKDIWWQCDKGHEWKNCICNRSGRGDGCPYCSGHLPSEEYNLLKDNPELCKEWDYKKNKKSPKDYTPKSTQKVWWICKECEHKWKAGICDRNSRNSGCPKCNKSKGERRITKRLEDNNFIRITQKEYDKLNNLDKNNNIYYIPQKKYKGLLGVGNGNLSYDFYLPNLQYNLLVEYQGEYHDGSVNKKSKLKQSEEDFLIQQEHDKRKREYAHIHNINLLEIWYWDFDNIESILEEYLN